MVHIHDTLSPSRVVKEVSEYEQLHKELQRVVLPGQVIELQHSYVAFGHCSPCVTAYSRWVIVKHAALRATKRMNVEW